MPTLVIADAATFVESQLCAGEEVIVVGGGNSAKQAAVFLAQTTKRVYLLVRSNGLADSMSRYLVRRIEEYGSLYGSGDSAPLKESIELNEKLGVKHTPELKEADPQWKTERIDGVFGSQEIRPEMIDEFKAARVDPDDVWPQSFNPNDVVYWIRNEPRFGKQAVYLDDINPTAKPPVPPLSLQELEQRRKQGVKIIAPPLPALLSVTPSGDIVPSQYAEMIKRFGFDIITWSFERSDLRRGAAFAGFYFVRS